MPLIVSDMKMPLHIEQDAVLEFVSNALNLQSDAILRIRIVRQSLDARKKQDIHFRISVEIELAPDDEKRLLKRGDPRIRICESMESYALKQGAEALKGRIVIAGFGPAGLFAAYFLSLHGYKPLVVERGADVDAREKAVARFWSEGILDEESNVAFGEGGAGTFSDGKLTSRSKNPRSDIVLRTLCAHGAPEEILFKAKPHIGTDKLRAILKEMRGKIIEAGGEVSFLSKLVDIKIQNGRLAHVHILKNGELVKIPCAACILATGHSARDTYRMLLKRGVMIAPKPFAVGVRIEHPQELINQAQFGALMAHPRLGAAEYQLKA